MKLSDPFYKLGTAKNRNFVFGAHIDYNTYKRQKLKVYNDV